MAFLPFRVGAETVSHHTSFHPLRNRYNIVVVLFYPSKKRRIFLTFGQSAAISASDGGSLRVPPFSLERGSRHEGADEDDQVGKAGGSREEVASD
jgi:hypothetical protein